MESFRWRRALFLCLVSYAASLAGLVKVGKISRELALDRCHDPEELNRLLRASDGSLSVEPGAISVKGYDVG